MDIRMTKRGRRALRAGLNGLSPEARLAMEILGRIRWASRENVTDLMVQLIDRFGSIENAIVAVQVGNVGFESERDQKNGATQGTG